METKKVTGRIFDIQRYSVHDGPGIRTTVFFKGCPLRCAWCHSPESQMFSRELNWLEIRCIGVEICGKCINACQAGAISCDGVRINPADGQKVSLISVDRSKCNLCFECVKVCTPKALYVCGTDYTVDELMGHIRRDWKYYKRSGGGVTLSGGECLWQPEFLLEVLKACRNEDIRTAIDTTGYAEWGVIESILPYADIFLYDIKSMDSALHEKLTGVPNDIILENAVKIASAGGKFQIRVPIIPLFNDSIESFKATGKFILELGSSVDVVQLLPYHTLGTVKWKRLLVNVPVFEAAPPSDELVEERKKLLEDMGLRVMVH